jgi:hypothetical protein
MVIDTSLPTIVPPLLVLAKAPIINQPRDRFAQLKSPLPKTSEYSVRAKHKVAAQIRRRESRLIERSRRRCPLVGNAELLGSFGLWRRTQQRLLLGHNSIQDF